MKKKLSCIVFLALVMLVISISPIYAGNWKKDNKGGGIKKMMELILKMIINM